MTVGIPQAGAVHAHQVYTDVVRRLPEITGVLLRSYRPPPPPLDRVPESVLEAPGLDDARRRHAAGSTFREAFLSGGARPVDEGILQGALYHQRPEASSARVSREEILDAGLEQAAEAAGLENPWALLSAVGSSHREPRHLPLLDFACTRSAANLRTVIRVAHLLIQAPFCILETVRSYHLVGEKLLDSEEARKFLGQAVLLGPLVDYAYVGHQLIEGSSALRVSGYSDVPPPVLLYSSEEGMR